jgi:hypothetical protein
MNLKSKYWFLLILLVITVSCGFQPIYKTGNEKERLLEFNLNFYNEPSYEIKNTIKSAFLDSQTTALYSINLDVIENQSALVTNANGTVSKYRVEVIINFEVDESSSGKNIYTGISRGFSEYLVQTSEIETNGKYKQAIEIAAHEAVQMMSIKIQSNILQAK